MWVHRTVWSTSRMATPARITAVDIRASNRLIHATDKVLILSPL